MSTFNPVFVVGLVIMGGLIGVLGGNVSALATEKLIICAPTPQESSDGKFQRLFFTEAYRRVGVEADVKHYPQKRCSTMANGGRIAGETERVYEYNKYFANLIRVEEPIRHFRFVAYAMNPAITLDGEGWESLRGTTYNVEYLRGTKRAQVKLTELISSENLSKVQTVAQSIRRLERRRIDIFISLESMVQTVLSTKEFQGYPVYQVGLMDEFLSYSFLHKKHQKLALKLADMIKQMKAEGLVDEYLTRSTQK